MNVKSIDNSSPYLYPSRSLEIKCRGAIIHTPIRSATSYEYNAKAKVPSDIPINNPVSLTFKRLSAKDLELLLTTNGGYARLLRRISADCSVAQYSFLKCALIQPTLTSKKPAMDTLSGSAKLLDDFLRLLIQLQREAQLDIITVPYLELPLGHLKTVLIEVNKACERIGKLPFFFVDMGYPHFPELISILVNQINCNLVGLIYKPFRLFSKNYEVLRQYHDYDVAFFMAQVYRADQNYEDFATMHSLPFLGNDIYAVETPSPFVPADIGTNPPLTRIKIFGRKELKVRPIRSIEKLGAILNDIDRPNDTMLQQMLKHTEEANSDSDKYHALNGFSRVHELIASSAEFGNVRSHIEDNSTKDYIEQKEILKKVLSSTKKSGPLNGFFG